MNERLKQMAVEQYILQNGYQKAQIRLKEEICGETSQICFSEGTVAYIPFKRDWKFDNGLFRALVEYNGVYKAIYLYRNQFDVINFLR